MKYDYRPGQRVVYTANGIRAEGTFVGIGSLGFPEILFDHDRDTPGPLRLVQVWSGNNLSPIDTEGTSA